VSEAESRGLFPSVVVLGVPVEDVTEADVLQFVRERVLSRSASQIATVNAEFVMHAQENERFRRALLDSELRTPDGMGVVLAARRRGVPIPRRVGGSDLIWSISEQAARLGHRVFLLGAGPGIAQRAAQRLSETFPGLEIAGTFAGSPRTGEDAEQIDMILGSKPDILFVAYGAPDQEIWIDEVKNRLGVPVIMGVGGSFDYVAGVVRRSPRWMQNIGLDWLFRLLIQPWRLRRMLVLPRFALLAMTRSD